MGNSLGGGGGGGKEVDNKIRLAEKTKILNLSEGGHKTSSSLWEKVGPVCPSLKTLDISGNRFSDGVPAMVFALTSVRVLHLSSCALTEVPDLSVLICLATLKLDHNKLTNESIVALPVAVSILDLSFNHLTAFPVSLIGLPAVHELNLQHNQLVELGGIETLTSLISINCDHNRLSELSETIGDLKNIKNISMAHNRLRTKASPHDTQCIPAGLFTSTQLQSLCLEGNSELSNKTLLSFVGIEDFLARRQQLKQKNLQGGGMNDFSVFGLA